jgi:hypothetical protein
MTHRGSGRLSPPRLRLSWATTRLAAIVVLAGLGACGSSSKVASTTVQRTRVVKPKPIPAPLAGEWHARFGSVDQKIAFSGDSYRVWVKPDDVARGLAAVQGSRVRLYGSTTCGGSGTYRWSVVHGVLTFRQVGEDPCPRAQLLARTRWRRR